MNKVLEWCAIFLWLFVLPCRMSNNSEWPACVTLRPIVKDTSCACLCVWGRKGCIMFCYCDVFLLLSHSPHQPRLMCCSSVWSSSSIEWPRLLVPHIKSFSTAHPFIEIKVCNLVPSASLTYQYILCRAAVCFLSFRILKCALAQVAHVDLPLLHHHHMLT